MRSEEEIKNEIHWLLKNDVREQYKPIINTLLWVLGKDLDEYLKEMEEDQKRDFIIPGEIGNGTGRAGRENQ